MKAVACTANGVEFVELQVAIDGLTVVVNPENTWATCLTVEQLATIYGPDSKEGITWADVDPSWPAEPIDAYMPGADSGTFDYFTEEINGEVDVAAQWPTQSEDDNILVTGVAGDKNAIGFFGYAYFVENQDKLKAVEIDGGAGCVAPTESHDQRQLVYPAEPAAVHLPGYGQGKDQPRAQGLRGLLPGQREHPGGRGRLRGRPGRHARGRDRGVDGGRRPVIAQLPPPPATHRLEARIESVRRSASRLLA